MPVPGWNASQMPQQFQKRGWSSQGASQRRGDTQKQYLHQKKWDHTMSPASDTACLPFSGGHLPPTCSRVSATQGHRRSHARLAWVMVEEDGPACGPGAPGSSGSARMTLVSFSPQVTHLLIKRPPLFHYRPGDYLYLNIPSIARYEWHPFTISSAPEQKGRPAPTLPVPRGVLLRPCHVPSKAVNQEHRGKQDPRHKFGLPDLPLEHGGRCADAD